MSDLELRMTAAKATMIERRMLPRAFYLRPEHFERLARLEFDHVPVRVIKGLGSNVLYSTRGCLVSVPKSVAHR